MIERANAWYAFLAYKAIPVNTFCALFFAAGFAVLTLEALNALASF